MISHLDASYLGRYEGSCGIHAVPFTFEFDPRVPERQKRSSSGTDYQDTETGAEG